MSSKKQQSRPATPGQKPASKEQDSRSPAGAAKGSKQNQKPKTNK